MGWDQIGIALTGVTAIYLSQSKSEGLRKYACVFGLCAQPFWFYTTYTHEQWGIFAMSFLYTFSWARGAWNFWIAPALLAGARERAFALVQPHRPIEERAPTGSEGEEQ